MGNIKIIKGVFDSSLELVHAEVAAGFPDITVDYAHETLCHAGDRIICDSHKMSRPCRD